jgi:two-component system nitrogen regulation response regulator NtrX
MQAQDYPGNGRELKNIMERIYLLCDKEELEPEDIIPVLPGINPANTDDARFWQEAIQYQEKKRQFEIRYLSLQLKLHGGNISRTAEALGLQQSNLSRKLAELGLNGYIRFQPFARLRDLALTWG